MKLSFAYIHVVFQVGNLHSRMEEWCKDIVSTVHLVKDEMPELVSQLSR